MQKLPLIYCTALALLKTDDRNSTLAEDWQVLILKFPFALCLSVPELSKQSIEQCSSHLSVVCTFKLKPPQNYYIGPCLTAFVGAGGGGETVQEMDFTSSVKLDLVMVC